jgi:hypothetical protein
MWQKIYYILYFKGLGINRENNPLENVPSQHDRRIPAEKKFYEVLNEKIKELELDFQTNFGPSNRLFNQSRKPRHGP